mmetsp:Transcript_17480/g.37399  ORF Transcript_17480/g.37399 Transcript_17480/m.37399 type:complete len:230 (+) Transcript_17480:1343-2032(+)
MLLPSREGFIAQGLVLGQQGSVFIVWNQFLIGKQTDVTWTEAQRRPKWGSATIPGRIKHDNIHLLLLQQFLHARDQQRAEAVSLPQRRHVQNLGPTRMRPVLVGVYPDRHRRQAYIPFQGMRFALHVLRHARQNAKGVAGHLGKRVPQYPSSTSEMWIISFMHTPLHQLALWIERGLSEVEGACCLLFELCRHFNDLKGHLVDVQLLFEALSKLVNARCGVGSGVLGDG